MVFAVDDSTIIMDKILNYTGNKQIAVSSGRMKIHLKELMDYGITMRGFNLEQE